MDALVGLWRRAAYGPHAQQFNVTKSICGPVLSGSMTDSSISASILILAASVAAGCSNDHARPSSMKAGTGGTSSDTGSNLWSSVSDSSAGGVAAGGGSTNGTDGGHRDAGADATLVEDASVADGAGDPAAPLALSVTIDEPSIVLLPGGTGKLTASVANDPAGAGVDWSITGGHTIVASGQITVAASATSGVATVTATSKSDPTKKATARLLVVLSGTVTGTAHPLVASYTITSPVAARLSIQFGESLAYEKTTSDSTVSGTAATSVLVAGMVAEKLHHMRAVLAFDDGTEFVDADHTFTTGTAASGLPTITTTINDASKVTAGVELVSSVTGQPQVVSIDMQGRIVWYYGYTGPGSIAQPVQALPNGHFLAILSPNSLVPLGSITAPAGAIDVLREFDLAGNTVRELSRDDLAAALTTAAGNGCAECGFTPAVMHHEVLPLPNGHKLLFTNTIRTCEESKDCSGGDASDPVLGDVVVDLDENWTPVWAWNEFNHLSVSRSSFSFPDWTHSNAIVYSPDDGALLVSIRHLAWVVKVAYDNGKGDGHIIWKLGNGGDFTLQGGTAPQDWFNAQHAPSFASTTMRSGVFPLIMFDNGTFRPFDPPCTTDCTYSRVPIFQVDETQKTATLVYDYRLPSPSLWGGNAEVLESGNIHVDLAQPDPSSARSDVYELTQTDAPSVVMRLNIQGLNAYRSRRLSSLYPGVTWR